MKCSQLVEDFDLYPRADVDDTHVTHIAEAIEAGAEIPPLWICSKSKRIVDGFHRRRAWMRIHGDDADISVILKDYASEGDLFLDAMRLNASHGRNMSSYDRTRAIAIAETLGIEPDAVATALNMTVERITSWKHERACKIEGTRRLGYLKQPIRHMQGQTLTKEQADVIPKLGGNQQLFYVRQLRMLIDNGMVDMENEVLLTELRELGLIIGKKI
jgi:hypothetical protein